MNCGNAEFLIWSLLSLVIFIFFCCNFISIHYHTQKQTKSKNYLRYRINYNTYKPQTHLNLLKGEMQVLKYIQTQEIDRDCLPFTQTTRLEILCINKKP